MKFALPVPLPLIVQVCAVTSPVKVIWPSATVSAANAPCALNARTATPTAVMLFAFIKSLQAISIAAAATSH
ncbi:hypothetical protein AB4Y45_20665 [Paraburkholderia sp. EG287A]|uniref:hypothetical protein n=1 Tax=Paraburkholderia sp. EG287A TaxID=3237012 RepID=UPI0034D25CC5